MNNWKLALAQAVNRADAKMLYAVDQIRGQMVRRGGLLVGVQVASLVAVTYVTIAAVMRWIVFPMLMSGGRLAHDLVSAIFN